MVLTERIAHLKQLSVLLEGKVEDIIVLNGGMPKKLFKATMERLDAIEVEKGGGVILATGKYIGEGFDASTSWIPCF